MSPFTTTPLTHQEMVATINGVEAALDRMASALHHPYMCPTELACTESPMATVWTLYNHVDETLEVYTVHHFNRAVSPVQVVMTSLDADGEIVTGTAQITLEQLQAEVDRDVPRWEDSVARNYGHI